MSSLLAPAPEQGLPTTSVCPRCGAGLRCAMVAGDAECWCAQLPNIVPLPSTSAATPTGAAAGTNASCYCPSCLKQITDERQKLLSASPD